ncbi:flagellar hook-associated protein FlgK [Anaerospora hongkongensis]|uniref:flagellar hook-associated protein FlgK n=1 Tax=Anaerospora hongkongensis TaxID=244830 RepID=UPI002FD94D70
MASTFMGMSIATRGLTASQAGLAVTNNNMSNVNTNGYSRQVVNQTAVGPAAVYSSNYVGAGVSVESVDRVRSFRLDQKYWQENSSLASWEAKSTYLGEVETIFGSTTDNGFSTTMDEFYSALEDLSTDPSSTSARSVVVETGNAVCAYLNDSYEHLEQLRNDINSDVKTAVTQINSYAQQIAALNQQITTASSAGASTNELEDARDALIDKLSALADIDVTASETGTSADGETLTAYTISINGNTLVNGNKAKQLECYTITDGSSQEGLYGIRWADTGDTFDPGSTGSLKAYLDLRDGTGTDSESKGIPYYISQLNEFAQTFAKAFNEGIYRDGTTSSYTGHSGGVGLDDSTGIRFFSYDGLSSDELLASGTDTEAIYKNITAANISLSKDVQEDVNKIAAASSSGESGNNEGIDDLISICKDTKMFSNGSPEDFYNSIISTLGTASSYAQRQYKLQTSITDYIDNSRSSVSGVSTDEETVNLTKYQAAYKASAQVITVWDEIYKTTINMVSSD